MAIGKAKLDSSPDERRTRFLDAAIRLLEDDGPAEIKARAVATAAGSTTMGLYTQFGSIPDLLKAVVDEGFRRQAVIFGDAPKRGDPLANLASIGLACRRFAYGSPHLYDLMYGLSLHGRYNNDRGERSMSGNHLPPAFDAVFSILLTACEQMHHALPIATADPQHTAYQVWSTLHGFLMLDLAGHFDQVADPAAEIMLPMCINLVVGMGADRVQAERSAADALAWWAERDVDS